MGWFADIWTHRTGPRAGVNAEKQIPWSFGQDFASCRGKVVSCSLEALIPSFLVAQ